jgi:O-acetyl-ADP-ribose deacetylase (regulator of RNase III)
MLDIMVIFERKIKGKIFRFIFGSIIDEPVEAIVNPANENLIHGGGVAGLISRTGGFEVQAESNKKDI